MKGLYRPAGRLIWMYRYTLDGKQVRESTGERDEAKAIGVATEIRERGKKVNPEDHPKEIDLYFETQRAADRLSVQSVDARKPVLLKFFRDAGNKPVTAITTGAVQQFYDSQQCGEDAKQTYVRWIRAFYKFLIERRVLQLNPCKGVKMGRLRPAARKSTITKEQVAKLIEECQNDSLKFVLFCGFHAGMRKREVIEARPEWFDLSTGHIHIGPTATWIPKDRERRSVPLSKAFRAFLKDYDKRGPYMLEPDIEQGRSVYRYDFDTPYHKHLKAVGVKCTFHDARRTFASQLVSAGVSIYKVATWLGDGVRVVEKHYGHLQPDNGDLERGFA